MSDERRSSTSLEAPERKRVEDPGAHELESDSDEQFEDAHSAFPRSPESTSPIPRTRVERVDDSPAHGEVPGTEAYSKRTEDATPDEIAVLASPVTAQSDPAVRPVSPGGHPIPKTVLDEAEDAPGTKPHHCHGQHHDADATPDMIHKPHGSEDAAATAAAAAGNNEEGSGDMPETPALSSPAAQQQQEQQQQQHDERRGSSSGIGAEKEEKEENDDDDDKGHDEGHDEGHENNNNNNNDDFGDDFDDFEEGGDDDDFGDFDDGFQQAEADAHPHAPSPAPASSMPQPPPPQPSIPSFPILDIDGLDSEDILAATEPYLNALYSQDVLDLPPLPSPPKDNPIFFNPRSASLWSQLAAPPPLQPPDWIRSPIRRLFLVSLGVPVDLDEILPASKQKKLVLPSLHRVSSTGSLRNSTDSRSLSRVRKTAGGDGNDSSVSVDSQGKEKPRREGGATSAGGGRKKKGPPEPPDLDLVSARQLCATTEEALGGMTDAELRDHVRRLEELEGLAKDVLEFWKLRTDEKIGDREAFEGVIENLVKHARKTRK